MATVCPVVNEAGVSRKLGMLICVLTLSDFIFLSGGVNEMFAGKLQKGRAKLVGQCSYLE